MTTSAKRPFGQGGKGVFFLFISIVLLCVFFRQWVRFAGYCGVLVWQRVNHVRKIGGALRVTLSLRLRQRCLARGH